MSVSGQLGVRLRTTIAATLVVAFALTLAVLGLVLVVQRSLVRSIDAAGILRARDVAALAQANRLPTNVPSTGEQASVVQVVSASGQVLASSPNVAGEPALSDYRPTAVDPVSVNRSQLPIGGDGEKFRLTALRVVMPSGSDAVVYVATSLNGVTKTVTAISALAAIGVPCLLVVVASMTWLSTGRTLRPVEAIRARVAAIGGSDLGARVPIPSGQDEVARLAITMNAMLERVEHAAIAQRRFVGDASHELRGPLAALRTQAEVALAHPAGTGERAVIADMLGAVERLSDLVEDLLLLAHADEGRLAAGDAEVDLDDIVLAESTRLRDATNLTVSVARLQPSRTVGNAARLTRALRNVGDNAARHARTAVTFALTQADGQAVISVTDDGAGIPVSERQRIFDRFTRLDAARDRDLGGTGLGLAITREIVVAHGGDISVADAAGGKPGAMVVIRLPCGHSHRRSESS